MMKAKKQRRQARKARLMAEVENIKSRLLSRLLEPAQEVEYVLPLELDSNSAVDGEEASMVKPVAAGSQVNIRTDEKGDAEEDRVELPALGGVDTEGQKKSSVKLPGRKHLKMTWQQLKLAVAERYGAEVAEVVDEHDGNSEDPFFTVLLKTTRRTVPVPRHWQRLRSFMSLQADREEAVNIILPEIQALGVDKLRAMRDKRVNPDQIAFMTCFLTGTPLQRKTFDLPLSRFGDVFYEGKWAPKVHFEPGKLSERLRQALLMGPNAPPPWLYSMQAMRRLPPAYPSLRIPGLNAPIPPGAQWGRGQGQWGEPPRAENNAFLFPGVMDEAAVDDTSRPLLWGCVPSLVTAEEAAGAACRAAAPQTRPKVAPPSAPLTKAGPKVTLTPTPFHPKAYAKQPPMATHSAGPKPPQEYVRVQDSGAGVSITVGYKMVPKSANPLVSPAMNNSNVNQRPPPPAPAKKF